MLGNPGEMQLGRTMGIAGLCELVALVGKSSTDLLNHSTSRASWLLVPAVGVGVAMVTAGVQVYGKPRGAPRTQAADPSAHAPRPTTSFAPGEQRRRGSGRTSLAFAVLVFILVLGVGGLGVSEGARSATAAAREQIQDHQDAEQAPVTAGRGTRDRPRTAGSTPRRPRQAQGRTRQVAPPPPPPSRNARPRPRPTPIVAPPPPPIQTPPPPPPIQTPPPPPPAQFATVPDVTGFNNVRAAIRISDAGLRSETESENSSTVPFGRVIRTEPSAGTSLPRDSRVTMYVSSADSPFG